MRDDQLNNSVRIVFTMLMSFFGAYILLKNREAALGDPDIFWHIRTGQWIWENKTFPETDPFSFTFSGAPWIAKEWLSQMLFFGTYHFTGWNGITILAMGVVALGAGCLYWILSEDLNPVHAGIACIASMWLALSTFIIRPHLLTFAIIILWTHQLFKASRTLKAPHFAWLLVLVLWANLHAAFTMGIFIAAFAFLDFLERTRGTKKLELLHWVAFLILCPIATLIHPYTWQALLATLTVVAANEAVPMIAEWQPFNVHNLFPHGLVLIALAGIGLFINLRLGWAKIALSFFLIVLFLSHFRYAYFLFPVLAIFLAPEIAQKIPKTSVTHWIKRPRDAFENSITKFSGPIITALICVIMFTFLLPAFFLKTQPPEKIAATKAISFLKKNILQGRVLNAYDFGGPLILNDIKTFIDGRTDQLFLGGFINSVTPSSNRDWNLNYILEKYDIEWTLFPPDDGRVQEIENLIGWERVYADEFAIIHHRIDIARKP